MNSFRGSARSPQLSVATCSQLTSSRYAEGGWAALYHSGGGLGRRRYLWISDSILDEALQRIS